MRRSSHAQVVCLRCLPFTLLNIVLEREGRFAVFNARKVWNNNEIEMVWGHLDSISARRSVCYIYRRGHSAFVAWGG